MACAHRTRERHRDVLADPPGAQPGRFPLHQPRQPGEKARSRDTYVRPSRPASSSWPISTFNSFPSLDRQFLVEAPAHLPRARQREGPRGVAIGPQEKHLDQWQRGGPSSHPGHALGAVAPRRLGANQSASTTSLKSNSPTPTVPSSATSRPARPHVAPAIRVGVMLHLPALVQTKQTTRSFRALQKINLAVRGPLRRGTQAFGDFLPDLESANPGPRANRS